MRKKRLLGPYYTREVEEEIGDYRKKLVTAVEASGTYAGSTTEHHPDARRLILYGVGDVPPESVAHVIDAAPDMVKVVWRPAPYTRAELIAERDRIMARFPQLNGGAPASDGTRLWFTTTDPGLLEVSDPRAALGSGYPVLVEHGAPVF